MDDVPAPEEHVDAFMWDGQLLRDVDGDLKRQHVKEILFHERYV